MSISTGYWAVDAVDTRSCLQGLCTENIQHNVMLYNILKGNLMVSLRQEGI